MRKKLLIMVMVLLACLQVTAFAKTRLTVSATETTLFIGDTALISVTCDDPNITPEGLIYSSNATRVATVDEQGIVTAISAGHATITVKTADKKLSSTIQISAQVRPEQITPSKDSVQLAIGKSLTLKTTVLPKNTTNKKVRWMTSDETIATVSSSGVIKGIKQGECSITAVSVADEFITASVPVEVILLTKSMSYSEKSYTCLINETIHPKVTFAPEETSIKEATYSTSNKAVATVNEAGVVTGLKVGKATITAKATDGSNKHAKFTVEVLQPVEGVHMKREEVRIAVGYYSTIEALMEPSTASNKNMSWFSLDESIATVKGTTNKPRVTAHAWGTTKVIGTTEDGGFTTEITIHGGSYRFAIRINSLRINSSGKPSLTFTNVSNLNIAEVRYAIVAHDKNSAPIAVSRNTNNPYILYGTYSHVLAPDARTVHGQFSFHHPTNFAGMSNFSVAITGLTTVDGFHYSVSQNQYRWIDSK